MTMSTVDGIFNLIMAVFLVIPNVTISFALYHMKRVKRTTIVFLAHLAVSNLVAGIMFIVSGVFYISGSFDELRCIVWVIMTNTTSGNYVTGIFFVYLDLYLSLKKMCIGRSAISTALAVGISCASWLVWIVWGAVGFGMRNAGYAYDSDEGCLVVSGVFDQEYVLMTAVYFVSVFVVIMVLHVLCYGMIKRSEQELLSLRNASLNSATAAPADNQQEVHVISGDGRSQTRRQEMSRKSTWLKKNEVVLKTITLILVLLIISWYPVILTSVIVVLCHPCRLILRKEVIYFTYALVAVQYNSNGIIYLIKIKEFQQACRGLCCRCYGSHGRVEPQDTDVIRTIIQHV